MNLTTMMKFELPASATVSEKAIYGLQVVAIGMGVVFGVLFLLIAILQVFKLVAIQKSSESKNAESAVPATVSAPAVSASAPVSVASVPASEEEAVVAIATAAIAASRGESECAFNVISIKKIVK